MKLTLDDIQMSRMWAEDAKGDDELADVMQHKLLSLIRQSHLDNQAYHERQATKCEREMDKIAARFKVEDEGDGF